MLKITTRLDATNAVLELEGRLAGAWVDELERCWQEIPRGRVVRVSLGAVAFIDESGKELLARIHASGAELHASGCLTGSIVQQILDSANRK